MPGASGAEMKAACTEAGMFALRERRVHVTQEDFEMACAKVRPGCSIFSCCCPRGRLENVVSPSAVDCKDALLMSSLFLTKPAPMSPGHEEGCQCQCLAKEALEVTWSGVNVLRPACHARLCTVSVSVDWLF